MLNRKILRAKAMQAVYAYEHAIEVQLGLARDEITTHFLPDLLSMQPVAAELLDQQKLQALDILEKNYLKEKIDWAGNNNLLIRKAVIAAINSYNKGIRHETAQQGLKMIAHAERVYFLYLQVLALIVELAEEADREEKEKLLKNPEANESVFLQNILVQRLKNDPDFQQQLFKYKVSWLKDEESLLAMRIYQENLKRNETYLAYLSAGLTPFEQQAEFIRFVVQHAVFDNPQAQVYFEESDLYWEENKATVKSMVKKSLKSFVADSHTFELSLLSANWEDDKQFALDLYNHTVNNKDEYDAYVAEKSANWDFERLAMMDKIIMRMAIAEMINFPSIPVKVTINEYVDLSKEYSTPQSKGFVNGLLDNLAAELVDKRIIRKSGRGLIDNKV